MLLCFTEETIVNLTKSFVYVTKHFSFRLCSLSSAFGLIKNGSHILVVEYTSVKFKAIGSGAIKSCKGYGMCSVTDLPWVSGQINSPIPFDLFLYIR